MLNYIPMNKKILLYAMFFVLSTGLSFGQATTRPKDETMIERYFSENVQSGGKVMTLREAMIKRSLEIGMYKHPGMIKVLKQVTTYKTLRFGSSAEQSAKTLAQLDQKIKKDHSYNEYFRYEDDDTTSSVIYTRGGKIINELTVITVGRNDLIVSCYIGDNISIESIRELTMGAN